jgi:hypothetical protein
MSRLYTMLLVAVSMAGLAVAQGSGNASLAELGSADANSDSPFLVTRTLAGKVLRITKDGRETLIVVEDAQGRRGVFTINQKSRFKADKNTEFAAKKRISTDDLEVGQLVKVTFVPDTGRVVQLRFAAKALSS